MQTSLSSLVDNLSEVYDKECRKSRERKKIRVNCEFVRFKNGRLNYKCKECKKSCTKVKMNQLKIFQLCINFVMVISIRFFCYLEKVFIHMNI